MAVEKGVSVVSCDHSLFVQTSGMREVSAPPFVVYALREASSAPAPVDLGGCRPAGGEEEESERMTRLRLIAVIWRSGTEAITLTVSHCFLRGIAFISGGVGREP